MAMRLSAASTSVSWVVYLFMMLFTQLQVNSFVRLVRKSQKIRLRRLTRAQSKWLRSVQFLPVKVSMVSARSAMVVTLQQLRWFRRVRQLVSSQHRLLVSQVLSLLFVHSTLVVLLVTLQQMQALQLRTMLRLSLMNSVQFHSRMMKIEIARW